MHKGLSFGNCKSCLSHLTVSFQIKSWSHCYTTKCIYYYPRSVLRYFSCGHQSSCLLCWKKYKCVLTFFSFLPAHPQLYQLFTWLRHRRSRISGCWWVSGAETSFPPKRQRSLSWKNRKAFYSYKEKQRKKHFTVKMKNILFESWEELVLLTLENGLFTEQFQ